MVRVTITILPALALKDSESDVSVLTP
ncbi:uncharacterized protein METZ01_LOCUS414767, partial [marine metagenome]